MGVLEEQHQSDCSGLMDALHPEARAHKAAALTTTLSVDSESSTSHKYEESTSHAVCSLTCYNIWSFWWTADQVDHAPWLRAPALCRSELSVEVQSLLKR